MIDEKYIQNLEKCLDETYVEANKGESDEFDKILTDCLRETYREQFELMRLGLWARDVGIGALKRYRDCLDGNHYAEFSDGKNKETGKVAPNFWAKVALLELPVESKLTKEK